MPRIIAGMASGRRIAVPPGRSVRPSTDRVREALFSALTSRRGGLDDARMLDLYAGSGAVGLEALSRGAAHALLVESERNALRALRSNVETLGLPGAEILAARVRDLAGTTGPRRPYDVLFADPPYAVAAAEVGDLLAALLGGGWLSADVWLVVERAGNDRAPPWPPQVTTATRRRYGDTALWYGRRS